MWLNMFVGAAPLAVLLTQAVHNLEPGHRKKKD
jgi:hypothetical protein